MSTDSRTKIILNNLERLVNDGTLKNKRVIFVGCINSVSLAIKLLQKHKLKAQSIVDESEGLLGLSYCGLPIMSLSEAVFPFDPQQIALLITHPVSKQMNEKLSFLCAWDEESRFNIYAESSQRKSLGEKASASIDSKKKKLKRFAPVRLLWNSHVYNRAKKELEKYTSEKERNILIFPHKSVGDPFLIAQYLHLKNPIFEREFVLLVPSPHTKKACELMGFNNVEYVDSAILDSIIRYKEFMGNSASKIKILHFDFLEFGFFNTLSFKKQFTFLECYETYVFNEKIRFVAKPKAANNESVIEFCKKNMIFKGKSVLLANQSNSIPEHSPVFWEMLAKELKNSGYDVFSNCNVEDPHFISGTKPLLAPLEMINEVCDYCGYIISERSGLIDFVSQCQALKIVVHYQDSDSSDSEFPISAFYEMSGFNLEYPIEEVSCAADRGFDECIKNIMNIMKGNDGTKG